MTGGLRRVTAIATGQLGAFTRSQAHAAGLSDKQLRSRVQSGILTQPGPNVFRLVGADDTPLHRLRSVALDIGGDVVASRFTAAALHGFDGYHLTAPFDLTIGRHRRVRRSPHRIHTAVEIPRIDRCEIDGVPATRAARTLIDLARHESAEQLTVALDSALRDRLVTETALHRRIVALRRQGMHGLPRLVDVIEGVEAIRGGHSWLEREFLRLVAAAGLPCPRTQVVMAERSGRLVRVDFDFEGTDVVVEVLGYRWHRTKRQLEIDTTRLNALIADGRRPYQFTYSGIVERPAAVVAELRSALGFV